MGNKFYLESTIKIQKETELMKEKASKIIPLPKEENKQPDLLYFSAIFVSSGENLNHAYFMGSELVAAEGTIINKALDVEHNEDEIIGHLYERAYIDKEGTKLDLDELSSHEVAGLDEQDIHIAVAGIIYKNRFPKLAQEVSDNKWKVSMECYFQSYDVKIGDLLLSKKESEALGLTANLDNTLGKFAKVIKSGKEIASGKIARVLRGICFSGCGIVKEPANPPSIIIETASADDNKYDKDGSIILNYDKINTENCSTNNVTTDELESKVLKEESRDGNLDDSSGICVNYKRRVYDKDGNIIAKDWCSAFNKKCTSFSRDTTDPDCLRNKIIASIVKDRISELSGNAKKKDKRGELLDDLKAALCEAVKTTSL